MARPLKKKDIVLSNEVRLESLPITKSKGRHWRATQRGVVIGEFMTWQQTTYNKQPEGDYGRGGGTYETKMRRWSWLTCEGEQAIDLAAVASSSSDEAVAEGAGVNTVRQFYDWKNALRKLPHPQVKKLTKIA